MLTDAQLERYSRQVLLPEVGGRGQERLLAAAVTLAGGGVAAGVAGVLLGRAGVSRLAVVGADVALAELSPDCRVDRYPGDADAPLGDVTIDLSGATTLGRRAAAAGRPFVTAASTVTGATLVTLVGQPCSACLPAEVLAPPPGETAASPLAAPLALLLGALAATEVLRLLLCPDGRGRVHRIGLATGAVATADLSPAGACTLCGRMA